MDETPTDDQDLSRKVDAILAELRDEYVKHHAHPWVVGFSGGKDSTCLLQLVVDMIMDLPRSKRRRRVYVVSNDPERGRAVITIGSEVQRRTGAAHKGTVLALREGQAQVQWHAGPRTGGGEFLPTVWTALDSIKIAGTSTTAHQGWCKAQCETVRVLIKQALALRGGGSLALAEHLNVDLSRVRSGKVRARVEYETAIEALRSVVSIS